MSRTVLIQPIKVFFKACMWGLMFPRKRGAFGTPEAPRFFAAGDAVPWDIEARWPLDTKLVFSNDSESYYENGRQVVRPLWKSRPHSILTLSSAGCALLVGASMTELNMLARPRGPKPAPKVDLVMQGGCA